MFVLTAFAGCDVWGICVRACCILVVAVDQVISADMDRGVMIDWKNEKISHRYEI